MLIDDIKIKVRAGNGGKGCVAFNKIKFSRGPAGGSGGKGGDLYFVGVSDLSALKQFRFKKDVMSEDGENGKGQFRDGRDGEDVFIKIPVGTVVHYKKEKKEIVKIGEPVLIAKGGLGGKGNFLFRSSRNTTPMQCQPGTSGEAFELRLELKMIADIGFIGFPNVGKSSLLKELTKADPKVANYPFTTLEPNLGVYYDLILADIPGLIEGASEGKGLGDKFLRHIERTKILFHFISAESEDFKKDYETIRNELGEYNKDLLDKDEYIFISKTDTISEKELKDKLKKWKKKVNLISIYNYESIEEVKKILNKIMKDK
ncbi:MAG: GTPase ObgE [Candidatus Pacebacteria bacterium]|nr:GTPase ObgE [Candidatus Paceibacterota bacterium]MDD4074450.1 GTPase ObgE [Candidatus Paceibacterota bacterium]